MTPIFPPSDALPNAAAPVIPEHLHVRMQARARPWRLDRKPPEEIAAASGRVVRRASMPARRRARSVRSVCTVIKTITAEMVSLTGSRTSDGRDCRFARSHIQQIAMYVCHIVLQMTMTEIAVAFGRDRTTVGHACARVEDRRDDHAYDRLLTALERVVAGVFAPVRSDRH